MANICCSHKELGFSFNFSCILPKWNSSHILKLVQLPVLLLDVLMRLFFSFWGHDSYFNYELEEIKLLAYYFILTFSPLLISTHKKGISTLVSRKIKSWEEHFKFLCILSHVCPGAGARYGVCGRSDLLYTQTGYLSMLKLPGTSLASFYAWPHRGYSELLLIMQ